MNTKDVHFRSERRSRGFHFTAKSGITVPSHIQSEASRGGGTEFEFHLENPLDLHR
jgi:hypothetical protein